MYEQFFGLTEKPFSIQPDPSFLYWGRTHRLAYAMLEYGVLNHAGISVITGDVGCGKTTLIHRLLDQLSDTHTVALLSNVQEGRGDLLSWVLMGFGQPFNGKSHVELFAELQNYFISEYAKGKRIVLIIDEAQNLSLDMLEELRLLSNINAGKDQLLQLILVGQPQLKGLLNRPELVQLAQRVGSDFHLTPLNKDEVQVYIETRMSIAGCNDRVFTDRALDLIAERSGGVPRIINVIADTALVYAFSAGEQVVSVETIRNVIRDKQDYGVFGIASDENATSPVNPDRENTLGSFEGKRPVPEKKPAPGKPKITPPDDEALDRNPPAAPASRPKSATITTKTMPTPAVVSAPVVAEKKVPKAAPVQPDHAAERGVVTGVIVIGTGNVSPEAAIRSAGDGRAIVYVPLNGEKQFHALARDAGAVVADNADRKFLTPGRARNAGYRQLKKIAPHIRFAQFLDASEVLDPDWVVTAEKFMDRRPEVAIIEGVQLASNGAPDLTSKSRASSEFGEVSVNTANALFVRADIFEAVGGFRGDLPFCESQDLCVRERRRGAHLWRLDAPMLTKAAEKKDIPSWWQRNKAQGRKNAFIKSLHGGPPERLGVSETRRTYFWAMFVPLFTLAIAAALAALASRLDAGNPLLVAAITFTAGSSLYLLRILVLVARSKPSRPASWRFAISNTFAVFPEFFGLLKYKFGSSAIKQA